MRLRSTANTVAVALIALGCGSTADDDDAAHGGASSGAGVGGSSAGAGGSSTQSGGGATGGAGKATMSGAGMPGTGGSTGGSGVSGSGGSAAGATGGAAGKSAMDSGSGGMPAAGSGGAGGSSGSGAGGAGAAGQTGGNGGTFLGCGGDGPCTGGMGGRAQGGSGSAGKGSAGMPGTAGGGSCPASGHVSYTLAKNASPTADEQTAYGLITTAMDKAIDYYNCYTNITKAESVTYVPSVPTADGNSNGSIRFGGKDYMEYITAMHEIAHTVGVGTYSQWGPLVVNGIFTGEHATTQLRAITGIADDQVHGDTQHFWPYGLNYTSEVKSEADVIDHCLMVVAIRLDMGFDP